MTVANSTSSLFNRRFAQNFLPIPATNHLALGSLAPPFELLNVATGKRVKLADYVDHTPSHSLGHTAGSTVGPTIQQTTSQAVSQTVSSIGADDRSGNCPDAVVLALTRIFTEQHYCPLCYPHIKALNEAYDQFRQRGAEVLMITSTDEAQSQIVLQDLGLKMPLLSDPSCKIFRQYRVGQALGAPLPAQFIVDRAGKLRFRHLFSFLEPNASVDRLLSALEALSREPVH